MDQPILAVAISGSPSTSSKSTQLGERALARLRQEGARTRRISLADLESDDLLGRTATPDLGAALDVVTAADIVVATTPVYRATFSGLLKVFFDLLPRDALGGKVGLGIATGAAPEHATVIDDLGRLFESVGASVVPGPYGLDSEFRDGRPVAELAVRVDGGALAALQRAQSLVAASTTAPAPAERGPNDPPGERGHVPL